MMNAEERAEVDFIEAFYADHPLDDEDTWNEDGAP
jgi:hypothetical protein